MGGAGCGSIPPPPLRRNASSARGSSTGWPIAPRCAFELDEEGVLFGAARGLRLLGATVRVAWQDWVLDFSAGRQERMLAAVGLGYLRAYGLAVAMLVVAGAVLGLLTLALVRGADRRDPLERIYQGFCDRLARIGLARGPSEGPADYARRVVAARPDLAGGVMGFMALYLPRRYRQGGGSADLRPLEGAASEVQAAAALTGLCHDRERPALGPRRRGA